MEVRVPDYFDDFSCLAGHCPHSCCTGWEVVIDEETAQKYQTAPGVLGDRLRAALELDEDGDFCFPLNGGRCPFLNSENLCDIHCAWGPEATSVTCREHPRFTEDYGAFKEITLAASCPRANELLLGSDAPLMFLTREDGDPTEDGDSWLSWLLPLREQMLALLQDRRQPLSVRLYSFLQLAQDVQLCIDTDFTDTIPGYIRNWQPPIMVHRETDTTLIQDALAFLSTLETLEPDWHSLLQQAASVSPAEISGALSERIAVYFAFRYLLKAVNDGDLLGRAALCVLAVLVIQRLAAVCGLAEALRRFSCEIEHDEDNLDALLDALATDNLLSPERLLSALSL